MRTIVKNEQNTASGHRDQADVKRILAHCYQLILSCAAKRSAGATETPNRKLELSVFGEQSI